MSFLNINDRFFCFFQFTALTSISHTLVPVCKVVAVTIWNASHIKWICECVEEKKMGGLDGKVQSGISFLLLHFLAFIWKRIIGIIYEFSLAATIGTVRTVCSLGLDFNHILYIFLFLCSQLMGSFSFVIF